MTLLTPFRFAFAACATAALVLAAGPAFAHAKLLSEVPAAEDAAKAAPAATAPVTEFRLSFSEGLNATFSKVEVKDSAGAAVSGATVALDPKDNTVLVVTFTAPLPKGEYTVDWTAVANDGHKTNGTYKVNVTQ
jgi:methionine-rich copper-binding protein CopC